MCMSSFLQARAIAFSARARTSEDSGAPPHSSCTTDAMRWLTFSSRCQSLASPSWGGSNGHALAGGFGLACACDLLVAVDSATFGTPEINVGVWPMMIQAILTRKLPRNVVLEMVMLGERWTAQQLQQHGLVNRVVAQQQLDEATALLISKLGEKSSAIMRLGRDSFYRQQDMDYKAALEYLHSQVTLVTLTEDSAEGRKAFFEKRTPRFTGR